MIVSNTTPISNFLHLKRMDILQRLFPQIHIPQAVKDEIDDFFVPHRQWQQMIQEGFFVVHGIRPAGLLKQFLKMLHQGEAEALCLALEQQAALCLVDDQDARAVALQNNIKVSGTFGILLQAKQRGIIKSVKPLMDELRMNHYFWIGEPMYQAMLQRSSEA